MADTVDSIIKKMSKIIEAIDNAGETRIGILGEGNARSELGGVTNAEIGAAHEFGTSQLPQRSFLRMPITTQLNKRLKAAGLFNEKALIKVLSTGSLLNVQKRIGILGERIVLEAFETGGFGKWKPSNMTYKKVHQTLVETQQLKDSITSDVVEKGAS